MIKPSALLSAELDDWTFGRFIDEVGTRHAALPAMVASDHSRGVASDHSRGIASNLSKAESTQKDAVPPGRWRYADLSKDVQALQWGLTDLGVLHCMTAGRSAGGNQRIADARRALKVGAGETASTLQPSQKLIVDLIVKFEVKTNNPI